MSAEVAETSQVSDRLLLDEFRAFAGRNALFRRCKLDGLELSVTEGEMIEDSDSPTDAVSLEYYFSARRHRIPVDENEITAEASELPKPHAFIIFKIGMVAMMEQTTLPPHVFEQAMGDDMLSDDADPEAEEFGIYHRLEFIISTSDRWLRATESYEYLDECGDTIYETNTDTDDEIDDYDLPESTVAIMKAESEQKEAELKNWLKTNGLALVEFELAEEQHDEHLRAAYGIFTNLKQALAKYGK